jgi:ATP-dependent Clp protease ATP-binding subunit ClpA
MDWNTNYENAAGERKTVASGREELHRRVVGQEEGIEAVSDAVKSCRITRHEKTSGYFSIPWYDRRW